MDSLRAILIETNYNYCFCTAELERIYSAELIIDFDPEARAEAARFVISDSGETRIAPQCRFRGPQPHISIF